MSRRVGQANSEQSHVESQQVTHMCLIRVSKESVTLVISTNHKLNCMKDLRALECVGSASKVDRVFFNPCVFLTRSTDFLQA